MQGLQRATEAARASRGLAPRIVHARSIAGGNNTLCGRGGITFSAPIADTPDEVTCKNCVKVRSALASHRQTVALSHDARWNRLRDHITQERAAQDHAAAEHAEYGRDDQSERCYERVRLMDRLLAVMDRIEAGQ